MAFGISHDLLTDSVSILFLASYCARIKITVTIEQNSSNNAQLYETFYSGFSLFRIPVGTTISAQV